jgi:hypothetical protein
MRGTGQPVQRERIWVTVVTQILLDEYQSLRVPAPAPTPADMRLCEQLASDELQPKITIRWLADGDVEVTAS